MVFAANIAVGRHYDCAFYIYYTLLMYTSTRSIADFALRHRLSK